MQIGTARPTEDELQGVPHYFLGHLSITQNYDAGQYEAEALALLDELFTRHRVVIMVGGSGMYIRGVTNGFDAIPEVPEKISEALNNRFREEGLEPLVAELQAKDPAYAAEADLHNWKRVIRALEVIYASGQPFSSFRTGQPQPRNFDTVKIGMELPREELYARLDRRMDLMLEQGLREEATALYDQRHHNALHTLGYTEVFDFIDGKQDWPETVRLLKRNNRRYAKRQLTWFRREADMHWLHPTDIDGMAQLIAQHLPA